MSDESEWAATPGRRQVAAELRKLAEALERTALLYELDVDSQEQSYGRVAAVVALQASIDFMQGVGFQPKHLRPLLDLAKAFQDADQGTAHPLIDRRKIGHRAPEGQDTQLLKLATTFVMKKNMAIGMDKQTAAQTTFRMMKKRGFSLRGNSRDAPGWKTVLNVYDRITSYSAGDELGDRFTDWLKRCEGMDHNDAIELVLHNLTTLVPKRG